MYLVLRRVFGGNLNVRVMFNLGIFFQINLLEPSLVDVIDTFEEDFDVGEVMSFLSEPCEELVCDIVALGVGK